MKIQKSPLPQAVIATPLKRGQLVRVFNLVADNFEGRIMQINKTTARVRSDGKMTIFTNHRDANHFDSEGRDFLVPFRDIIVLQDSPAPAPPATGPAMTL